MGIFDPIFEADGRPELTENCRENFTAVFSGEIGVNQTPEPLTFAGCAASVADCASTEARRLPRPSRLQSQIPDHSWFTAAGLAGRVGAALARSAVGQPAWGKGVRAGLARARAGLPWAGLLHRVREQVAGRQSHGSVDATSGGQVDHAPAAADIRGGDGAPKLGNRLVGRSDLDPQALNLVGQLGLRSGTFPA